MKLHVVSSAQIESEWPTYLLGNGNELDADQGGQAKFKSSIFLTNSFLSNSVLVNPL